jgi:hypothetical protein
VCAPPHPESRRRRVMIRLRADTTLLVGRSWFNFDGRQTVTRLPPVTIRRDGRRLAGEIPLHGVLLDQTLEVGGIYRLVLDELLR